MLTPAVSSTFAGSEVIRQLGSGGMGDVYLVRRPHLKRLEALKVTTYSEEGNSANRFIAEASTMASLQHPNIATVYDFGIDDGLAWYRMEYLPGTDLADACPLPVPDVITIVTQVARAIDYAHERRVVHRDIKPSNIHVRRGPSGAVEKVTVLDFGVAKLMDATALTEVNSFVGTLAYSAPETIADSDPVPASDQYSLACTAFELLTGDPPFPERTVPSLIAAHATAAVPPIGSRNPQLRAADQVFARSLAKDPKARFASCGEFANALTSALQPARRGRSTDDRHLPHPRLPAPAEPPRRVPPASAPDHSVSRPIQIPVRRSGPNRLPPTKAGLPLPDETDTDPVPTPPRTPKPQHPSNPQRSSTPQRRPNVPDARTIARRRWFFGSLAVVLVMLLVSGIVWAVASSDSDPKPDTETPAHREASTDRRSGGQSPKASDVTGETWGLVIDPDGATYAFRDYRDVDALTAAARAKWGYDEATWGLVHFTSGCGAFAYPVDPPREGGRYQYGLGPDRPSAAAAAVARSERDSGRASKAVDTLCAGDYVE
ncbi:MAG: protein kinase [Gordonia sp. (in: high G+C Gram-positive bacteria)]